MAKGDGFASNGFAPNFLALRPVGLSWKCLQASSHGEGGQLTMLTRVVEYGSGCAESAQAGVSTAVISNQEGVPG